MIIRSFVLVFISLTASLAFGNTATPPQEAPLFPTRSNFFTIPFEIKVDGSGTLPAEVELIYSNDRGMNWFPYGRVHPDKKQFLFKSPTDGEYWFILKAYGHDGLVKEHRRRGPMARVLVDTIPPRLTLSAEQKSTGEIWVLWSVEDANLARKTPQLQISYSTPDQKNQYLSNWKPVVIDPSNIQSEGNKHQGELVIWPEHGAVSLEIQAEVVDMAGNREMQSRSVSLSTIAKEEDSNVLTESMRAAFKQPEGLPMKPVSGMNQYTTAEPITTQSAKPLTPLVPPRPPVHSEAIRALPPPRPISNQIAGLSQINESLKSLDSVQPVRTEVRDFDGLAFGSKNAELGTETSGKDSVLVGPPLFLEDVTEEGSLVVGSPQTPIPVVFSSTSRETLEFALENEVEDGDDDGPKWFTPNPKYAPPELAFEDSPLVSSDEEEVETTEAAIPVIPEESVPLADTVMEVVEKSNAFIRITKISHLRDLRLSQILVKWETSENSWTSSESARVHIFRGPSQQGPWTPIDVNKKNTGSFAWTVSPEDRDPFYILLQCEGTREENRPELVSDVTMQPIQLPATLFK
ncbi:MAG: hypothetical protein FWC43_00865 [Planctomycetaceae bacterium]|nr:hypothetical protein [Planctomycetaceae bacterium]